MEYPFETQLKLKSREISFTRNIYFSRQIGFRISTEHGNDNVVLYTKFQDDLTNGQ